MISYKKIIWGMKELGVEKSLQHLLQDL